jgi:hypothetical protein
MANRVLLVMTLVAALTPADVGANSYVVITAAGDIATSGTGDSKTAALIRTLNPARVLTLGDNAYPNGTLQQFYQYYDPMWGPFKWKTSPSPGNHDYHTWGATGYFTYFGSRAPAPNYTYVVGNWRMVSLNSATNLSSAVSFLRNTLNADSHLCELVYFHHPRWSSGAHGSNPNMDPIWDEAVAKGVDVVLSGHDHSYERFAPLNSSGNPVSVGTRQFVVGTGGAYLYNFRTALSGSQRRIKAWGALRMELRADSYGWSFRNVSNQGLDWGSTKCHA